MYLSKKINKNYGVDITFMENTRWSEAIEFAFDLSFTPRCYEDHTPRFEFTLIIWSFTIIDITIYNLRHSEESEVEDDLLNT
jgi:hypothetical protein